MGRLFLIIFVGWLGIVILLMVTSYLKRRASEARRTVQENQPSQPGILITPTPPNYVRHIEADPPPPPPPPKLKSKKKKEQVPPSRDRFDDL